MGYGFGQLNEYAERAHANSVNKGFWSGSFAALESLQTPTKFNETELVLVKLMLIVTEVAEAAEAVREGDYKNFGEELADICIRTFDLAEACAVNTEQEIVNKMAKNEERSRLSSWQRTMGILVRRWTQPNRRPRCIAGWSG